MQIRPLHPLAAAPATPPAPRGPTEPADRFVAGLPIGPEGPTRAQVAELLRTDVARLEEWTAQVPRGTHAPPALGPDGSLYVVTEDGVTALRPDGSPRWTWKGKADDSVTPRVLPDGRVLIPGGYKNEGLICLGPDGQQLWKRELPASQEEAAPIPGGGFYYGDYAGTLHRLGEDGTPAWAWTVPDPDGSTHINGGPAVLTDGSAVVIADPGPLFAVNPDGSPKWARFQRDGDDGRASTCRQPLVTPDGDLLVTGAHNEMYSLDPETGATRWHYLADLGKREDQMTAQEREDYSPWGNNLMSGSPLLSPDGTTLYAGGMGGRVTALDRQGNKKWDVDLAEAGYHEPCTVGGDGTVYFVGMEGRVHALGPEGKPLWTFEPKDRSQYSFVAARGDTVYLTTSEGRVHALSTGALERRVKKAEAEGRTPVVEITDAEVVIGGVRLRRQ